MIGNYYHTLGPRKRTRFPENCHAESHSPCLGTNADRNEAPTDEHHVR
jgi:hypothetical protein